MSAKKLEQLRRSCRACVHRPGVLNVFAGSTLVKWLACTELRIYVNDGLPDSLCRQCNKNLEQAYSFRKKCIKSDEKLRNLIFTDTASASQNVMKKEENIESEQKVEMPTAFIEHVVVKMELNNDSETLPLKEDSISHPADLNFEDNCEGIEQSDSFIPGDKDYESNEEKIVKLEDVKDCPAQGQFSCPFCQQRIMDHKEYREHVQEHKNETYKCDMCHKVFWGIENIEKHKKIHTASDKDESPCQFCGLMFNIQNIRAHIKEKHASEKRPYVKCHVCNQVLHSTSIRGHLQRHENLNLPCAICSKTFRTKISLRDHEKTHTKAKPYVCFHCGKKFKTRGGRNVHTRESHTEVQAFKCPRCEHSFARRPDLTRHLKAQHSNGDTPEESKNMDAHKALEERPEYKETCEVCGKSFKRKSTLWTHLKIHCDEKPHPCRYCGKRFALRQRLLVHERTHTGVKPYRCPHCDAAYNQQSGVVHHFKTTHRGFNYYEERRRQAETQDIATKERSNGTVEVVHSSNQRSPTVICELCDASFPTKLTLRKHMKSHAKAKPYPCTICEKSFSLLHNKSVHERRHTALLPYQCPLCDEACAQVSEIMDHFKSKHQGCDYLQERRRKEMDTLDVSVEYSGLVGTTLETPSSLLE